jgi:hypothetical protein
MPWPRRSPGDGGDEPSRHPSFLIGAQFNKNSISGHFRAEDKPMIEESEPLPPLYANWLAGLLGGSIPRESHATCDRCAMCSANGPTAASQSYYFDPNVKCCSYVPTLPNFLVGRILSDDDPAALPGRVTVEKRIKEGLAVTPLGLAMPPAYAVLYRNGHEAFGRSRNLRCPHYIEDGGRCGIWRNRESTCATWFCKHVRGNLGFTFWRGSVFQLLHVVEAQLARWCVSAHQFSDDALRELVKTPSWTGQAGPVTAESMDGRIEEESYARIWAEWRRREIDFFIQCAKLVTDLSWNDVLAISGPEAQAYARLTKQAYGRLTSEEIPPRLKVGVFTIVQLGNGKTRIQNLNCLEHIDVSNVVMELLQYFDGRPTEEVVDAIAKEKKLRLDRSLVRKMVDFGVLVPSDSEISSMLQLRRRPA